MTFFTNVIGDTHSLLLLGLLIGVGALIIEDVTTVVVGVLAADGLIPVPLALVSLYCGIALGDTLLYTLGSLARTHKRLARYIEHDFTAPFRSWLSHKHAFKTFSGHFVPGLRITSYVASGFFRLPLSTYIPAAIAGGLVLMFGLFTLSYGFGSLTTKWLGPVRWGVAVVFLIVLFLIARHNVRAYREAKNLQNDGGDMLAS